MCGWSSKKRRCVHTSSILRWVLPTIAPLSPPMAGPSQAEADLIAGILGGQSYLNNPHRDIPVVKSEPNLSPPPSSALDCRVSFWRAMVFSPGGDAVGKIA